MPARYGQVDLAEADVGDVRAGGADDGTGVFRRALHRQRCGQVGTGQPGDGDAGDAARRRVPGTASPAAEPDENRTRHPGLGDPGVVQVADVRAVHRVHFDTGHAVAGLGDVLEYPVVEVALGLYA